MKDIYMIICKRPNGEKSYCTSGRNSTPFTTTKLSSAKGEKTKKVK